MKVLILKVDDWQGLYIEGKLISEGHVLGEGDSELFLLKQAEKFKFKSSDVVIEYLKENDEEDVNDVGGFPSNISDFKNKY